MDKQISNKEQNVVFIIVSHNPTHPNVQDLFIADAKNTLLPYTQQTAIAI